MILSQFCPKMLRLEGFGFMCEMIGLLRRKKSSRRWEVKEEFQEISEERLEPF